MFAVSFLHFAVFVVNRLLDKITSTFVFKLSIDQIVKPRRFIRSFSAGFSAARKSVVVTELFAKRCSLRRNCIHPSLDEYCAT